MPDEDVVVEKALNFNNGDEGMKKCISVIKNGVYGEDVREAIYTAFEIVQDNALSSVWSLDFIGDLGDGADLDDWIYVGTGGGAPGVPPTPGVAKCPFGVVYRLKGSRSFVHVPADLVTGQPACFVCIRFGTNVKQFIFYFSAGSNTIGKLHMRVYNNNTWSGWTTIDFLNLSGSTQNVVLG